MIGSFPAAPQLSTTPGQAPQPTAAALRSAKPNVALPLAADRPFWARRIHACGASPAPLDARSLTASQVALAVCQAIESDAIRRHASVIGDAIQREAGLENAVEIITRSAPSPPVSQQYRPV